MNPDHKKEAQLGTDVRYLITVVGKSAAHKVSIQSVEAYFINTTLLLLAKELQEYNKSHFKFLRRYPVEPLVNDYISTAYCLNNSGAYCYNARPINCYNGFGVEPFGPKHCPHPCPKQDESVSRAIVYYTDNKSTVQVYFPADMQKYSGVYDLLLRVTIYNEEYELDHTKTFSITYNGTLTLTGNAEDLPDGIQDIIIDGEDHPTPSDDDLFVIGGELDGSNLLLTLSDLTPVPAIDMSREFAWGEGDIIESNDNTD